MEKADAKSDEQPAVETVKPEDVKKEQVPTDQKQSFVDQVAEGLAAKVPADRFEKDEEEKKEENATTTAASGEPSKEPT